MKRLMLFGRSHTLPDGLGGTVTLKRKLSHWAALSPELYVTAVSMGAKYPAKALATSRNAKAPKGCLDLGGVQDLDLVALKEFKPQAVLVDHNHNDPNSLRALQELKLPSVHFSISNFMEAAEALPRFQQLFQTESVEKLVLAFQAMDQRPQEPHQVLCLVGRKPWRCCGETTLMGAMVRGAGASLLTTHTGSRYEKIGDGQFKDLHPDTALLFGSAYPFSEEDKLLIETNLTNVSGNPTRAIRIPPPHPADYAAQFFSATKALRKELFPA